MPAIIGRFYILKKGNINQVKYKNLTGLNFLLNLKNNNFLSLLPANESKFYLSGKRTIIY